MNTYLLLKIVHILAAIWFIAGIIGRQSVRNLAHRSQDVEEFAYLTRVAGFFEKKMVIPGNALVILFGLLVAWRGGWPVFGFLQGAEQNWLLVSNLILLAGIANVPLIFLPKGKIFDRALANALAAGQITPELVQIFDDRLVRWAHWSEQAGLLAVIVLMVAKPF